jgi:hypothetical protein
LLPEGTGKDQAVTHTRAHVLGWLSAGVLASALAAGPSWAQTADRDRQPKTETEGQAPSSGSLSDRLDRSDGVIRPPAGVDPQIQVPPPEPGARMPVIPPPDTPGGDQTIEPK